MLLRCAPWGRSEPRPGRRRPRGGEAAAQAGVPGGELAAEDFPEPAVVLQGPKVDDVLVLEEESARRSPGSEQEPIEPVFSAALVESGFAGEIEPGDSAVELEIDPQLFGAALLGYGVLNWLGREFSDDQARSTLVTANLATDAVGFIFALLGQLGGVPGVNALGWSTVMIYLLLAAGFAYLRFMSK